MEPLQGAFLGVVQGLTEFLPVSSSGHLVLFQQLFGLHGANLFFDISVHVGTLMAVIIFFRKNILDIVASVIRSCAALLTGRRSLAEIQEDHDTRIALLIVVGSVPTMIIGLLFNEIAEHIFSSAMLVGIALILNGTVLWLTQYLQEPDRDVGEFSYIFALIIGVTQGLAIIPGISRSGATIAAGLFLGLKREVAARFSFLLSIPAILGAQILSIRNVGPETAFDTPVIVGTLAAAVIGYAALVMLVYMVRKGQIHRFAPYCWVVGVLTLMTGWISLILEW